jgi:ankyrin repeat protein
MTSALERFGGWAALVAVAVLLLTTGEVRAQAIPESSSPPTPPAPLLLLPRAAPTDDQVTVALTYAEAVQAIFKTIQQVAAQLVSLPPFETFRDRLTFLRTEVEEFRATYVALEKAEPVDSFPYAVFRATDFLFAGIESWEAEVRAQQTLEGTAGTPPSLGAREARDAAANRRTLHWNTAREWIGYASQRQQAFRPTQQAETLRRAAADPRNRRPGSEAPRPQAEAVGVGEANVTPPVPAPRPGKPTPESIATDALIRAAKEGRYADIGPLTARLASPDVRGEAGETALHWAAAYGHQSVVQLLLSRGADANATDGGGATPLHYAAEEGHVEAVRVLIAAGADVEAENDNGMVPLHLTATNGNPILVDLLLSSQADVNATDNAGSTPLHIAAALGRRAAVLALLRGGADVEARDSEGNTPVNVAEANGHPDVATSIASFTMNK